jgi:hypothetical protein
MVPCSGQGIRVRPKMIPVSGGQVCNIYHWPHCQGSLTVFLSTVVFERSITQRSRALLLAMLQPHIMVHARMI